MKTFIKENTWLSRITDFGWGNGYALIPKENPLHGMHYDNINIPIHCGLTFSELVDEQMVDSWGLDNEDIGMWCVGFDTCHHADTLEKWPKEAVEKETERLKDLLIELSKTLT